MISDEEREAMVQEWLTKTSLPREVAEEMVAISLGEGGDIQPTRPLTPEEQERIFPNRTLNETLELMKRRARQSEQAKVGD